MSDSDSAGDSVHREGSFDLLDDDIPHSLPPPPAPIQAPPPPISPPYLTAPQQTASPFSSSSAAPDSDRPAGTQREETPESGADSADTSSTQL